MDGQINNQSPTGGTEENVGFYRDPKMHLLSQMVQPGWRKGERRRRGSYSPFPIRKAS